MSLELANYFQIQRLKELVRQHQDFKSAVFHSPLRIAVGLVLRAVVRPWRHLWRRSEIGRRTRAGAPPAELSLTRRYVGVTNQAAQGLHVAFTLIQPDAPLSAATSAIRLDSGNDRVIFVHAFYEREAQEIFARLERYTDYDLVLTTSVPAIRDAFLAHFERRRAICIEVLNEGRDILPFLLALDLLDLSNYRYFVKIHTKRSAHLSDGGLWFRLNLQFLLGNKGVSDAFFALLDERLPSLYGVDSLPVQDHLENNRHWMNALLGCNVEDVNAQFIPGSMFMGTGELLRKIAARQFHLYPMEAEAGQLDGTLAHALERYIGCLALQEGGECHSIESFLTDRGTA